MQSTNTSTWTPPSSLETVSNYSSLLSLVLSARPITPGAVVVCPRRPGISRLLDLSDDELLDMFSTARTIVTSMNNSIGDASAEGFNLALKDSHGAFSQLHLHVVPRRSNDFPENDEIYNRIDKWHPDLGKCNMNSLPLDIPEDSARTGRTEESMAEEAMKYRCAQPGNTTSEEFPKDGKVTFGQLSIACTQVFWNSELSFAFVNKYPLVNGHTLVSPRRPVARLKDLTTEEADDLWRSVKKVQNLLSTIYGSENFTTGIQDGPVSGQSVFHVHVHILPM